MFRVSPMDAIVTAPLAMKTADTDNRAAVRETLKKVRFESLLGGVTPGPTDHQEKATDTSALAVLKNGVFVPYTK